MNKFVLCGLLAAVVLGWHYSDRHIAVTHAIHTTETRLRTEYVNKYNQQVTNAALTTAKIQVNANESLRVKDEANRILDATLTATLVRMQDRPTRASGGNTTGTSGTRKACTGRELYREDGSFLAREAAAAEKMRVERNYYYDNYNNAKRELEALKRNASGLNGSSSNSEPLP